MSSIGGVPARPASGPSAADTSTNGSWSSSTASNGPSGIGSTPNDRSRRPGSTNSSSPWSLAASQELHLDAGPGLPNRPMIAGSTRVPTLW